MIGNPEFQRNLWLQLSPVRIVATPCILAAVFLLAWLAEEWEAVGHVALGAALLLGVFWGSRVAVDSVFSELSDRTWDAQRMTVIGPVSMALGKLFGATAFVWYIVIICAATIVVSVQLVPDFRAFGDGASSPYLGRLGYVLPMLFLVCLFAHAVALLCGLALLGSGLGRIRFDTTLCQFVALGFAFPIAQLTTFAPFGRGTELDWYGQSIPSDLFILGTIVVFTGWAVLGTVRLMRLELQATNSPLILLLFLAYVCVYVLGFEVGGDRFADIDAALPTVGIFMKLLICGGAVVGFTYLLAFIEPKSSVRLRLWWGSWKSGDLAVALCLMPRPVVGWLVCAAITIAVMATMPVDQVGKSLDGLHDYQTIPNALAFRLMPLAALLFVARDLLLFTYWTVDQGPRALIAAYLYLVLLYALAPMILGAAGIKLPVLVFLPLPTGHPALMVLAPLLQVVAAAVLLSIRARAKWRRGLAAQGRFMPT